MFRLTENRRPVNSSHVSKLGYAATTNTSSCKVCKGLKGRYLFIECELDELESTSRAGCGGCNLLYTVVTSFQPGIERCHISKNAADSGSFGLYLTDRYPFRPPARPGLDDLTLEMIVDQDDDVPWTDIPRRPSTLGLEDPSVAVRQIRQWLESCETHQECQSSSLYELPYLPTRVLELQGPENVKIHVSDQGERGRYACLSHCWGGIVPLRTTLDSLDSFQHDGIPWLDLPKTFQHAIDLVRQLGVRYLWIDSLCIVQDSLHDWRHEGSRMSEIYSGAYFTIAASNAPNSDAGLYRDLTEHRRPEGSRSFILPHPTRSGASYEVLSFENFIPNFKEARFTENELSLQQRAWAFQERLLSHRTVHFADSMLHWECLSKYEREFNATGAIPTILDDFRLPFSGLAQKPSPTQLQTSMHAIKRWHHIVSRFTSCKLTYQKDKLPALQGVARHLQREGRGSYFAGLWEDSLWYDALWYVLEPERATSSDYRAPSWSWASRDGEVHYVPNQSLRQKATIVSVATTPAGDDPMGELLGGTLKLHGPYLPATLERRSYTVTELILRDSVEAKITLEWYQDEQDHSISDRRVILLGLATSHRGSETHMLVLVHASDSGTSFKRIGQVRLNLANRPYDIDWKEGEFTII